MILTLLQCCTVIVTQIKPTVVVFAIRGIISRNPSRNKIRSVAFPCSNFHEWSRSWGNWLKCRIIGSLRSYDGNCNEYVGLKFNLVFCGYYMLCTLYKIGELHFRLLGTNDFHVKTKNERFTARSSRCRQNLKYIWELKQPRRRRQQKPHKFAYLTMKNSIFARFARAFFFFWHFEDQFCSWVDDVSAWWQMFNFVFLCPKRRF